MPARSKKKKNAPIKPSVSNAAFIERELEKKREKSKTPDLVPSSSSVSYTTPDLVPGLGENLNITASTVASSGAASSNNI